MTCPRCAGHGLLVDVIALPEWEALVDTMDALAAADRRSGD